MSQIDPLRTPRRRIASRRRNHVAQAEAETQTSRAASSLAVCFRGYNRITVDNLPRYGRER